MPYQSEFDGSIEPVLEEVHGVAGLEGLAIIDMAHDKASPRVIYRIGVSGPQTVADGQALLLRHPHALAHSIAADKRPILVCPWTVPPSRSGGVILWRSQGGPGWRQADHPLAAGLGVLLRTLVATGVGQIGIDRLTGLPNRRWFLDEVDRHLDRMALDGGLGTLTVIEISNLGHLNAVLGRDGGNAVLARLATQLRAGVRPGDAVARMAGDQFALWQPAMDHLTAAERANALCTAPSAVDLPPGSAVRLSIGIVTRGRDSVEDARALLHRAQTEVAQVRAQNAGGWRVSRQPRLGTRPT